MKIEQESTLEQNTPSTPLSRQLQLPFKVMRNIKKERQFSLAGNTSTRKMSTISEINQPLQSKQSTQTGGQNRNRFHSVDPSCFTLSGSSSNFMTLNQEQNNGISLSLISTTEQDHVDDFYEENSGLDEDKDFNFKQQQNNEVVDNNSCLINNLDPINIIISQNQNNNFIKHGQVVQQPPLFSLQSPQNEYQLMNKCNIPTPSGIQIIDYDQFQNRLEEQQFITEHTEDNLL